MSKNSAKSYLVWNRSFAGFLVFVAVTAALLLVGTDSVQAQSPSAEESTNTLTQQQDAKPTKRDIPQTAAELAALRAKHDDKYWADEVLAQEYERTFVKMWDKLIHETDKFGVLRKQRFNKLILGASVQENTLDWGIQSYRLTGPNTKIIGGSDWSDWLADFQLARYQIVETEWHHREFYPPTDASPARSTVSFIIHADNPSQQKRYVIRGNLKLTWAKPPSADATATADIVDATDLTVLSREGEPSFMEKMVEVFPLDPNGRRYPTTIHPVMLQDLNDDGLPEVVVCGFNRVYRNRGDWQFEQQPLCKHAPRHPNAGVFGDFTGDGVTDLFVGVKNGFPLLYVGETGGRFDQPPHVVNCTGEELPSPTAITAGDIDADGDLDIFIGQQKPAYHSGDFPTPYFNALDSFPGYLMINDGNGGFSDGTEGSGLEAKRQRRMYSASFIDFDNDGDLDLLTTSDFSGTDLFVNNGTGRFTDVSDRMQPKGYAFGMSHTFGDYNLDGHLDFLLIGMSSTTARRLDHLKLRREDFADYDEARMLMGYGNRLYLGDGKGEFKQAPFNATVARTGWSWGSTTLDFDNDADPDLYICNGQLSGKTTRDYCTRFWCHDVYYKEGERPDAAIKDLFTRMAPVFNGHGVSWNGYEHNALLMNLEGGGFTNIGYLMGIAYEFDARTCLAGDLDGDGRVDLLAEEYDVRNSRSRLFFIRNDLATQNRWIGVHLRSDVPSVSPLGALVGVELSNGRTLLAHNVSGHSVWAQHANTLHFGLGERAKVERVTIRWPDDQQTTLEAPHANEYHVVQPPNRVDGE